MVAIRNLGEIFRLSLGICPLLACAGSHPDLAKDKKHSKSIRRWRLVLNVTRYTRYRYQQTRHLISAYNHLSTAAASTAAAATTVTTTAAVVSRPISLPDRDRDEDHYEDKGKNQKE